ncbi:DsbA family protein [Agromyces archimandritae]|uniref:Thioredoxin domain-containing protein n=1 Tax=Agromyces archimandritae TaxID=2781962 RepID=A0A975FL99_9MICO|nr:thioredoxin domain-containing protein [Agromyces archimandritae]QTX03987.1 thioredoxin domain-containing protein [Agromyces archimandritae]
MTYGGPNQPRPTRNQRRDAAREKARALREQQKKRERRNKVLLQGGIIVAVVVVAALVVTLIMQSVKPAGPGPKNMASDGIVLTAGEDGGVGYVETPAIPAGEKPTPSEPDTSGDIANIVMYIDYLCPYCGQFEQANADTIRTMVEEGAATVEVHPIAMLNNKSAGTQYSLRAANAAGCVAEYDPTSFLDFNEALFADQPEELSTGLTNDQLKQRAKDAGVGSLGEIESCIDDVRFKGWVNDATTRAMTEQLPNSDENLSGTPTVLVNGLPYQGSISDPDEFRSFVQQAAAASYSEQLPTESPAPTETPAG